MNLTRHNYEEYFLLYVDGELAAEERLAVEVFLEEHPDLVEEMESLRMTILPQDEVYTFDKNILYRRDPEEAPARIIPLARRRLSIAAAITIGLLATGALWMIREHSHPSAGGSTTATVQTGAAAPAVATLTPTTTRPAAGTSSTATTPAAGTSPSATTPAAGTSPTASTAPAARTTMAPTTAAVTTTRTAHPLSTTPATRRPRVNTPPSNEPTLAITRQQKPAAGTSTQGTLPDLSPAQPTDLAVTHPGTQPHHPHLVPSNITGTMENNPTLAVTTSSPGAYHTLEEGDRAADGDKILFVRADQVVNGEVKGFFRRAGRLLKRTTSFNSDNVRPESDR